MLPYIDLIAIILLFTYYGRYLNRYCLPTNSEHHCLLFRVSAFICATSYADRGCGLNLITKTEVDEFIEWGNSRADNNETR